jgi:hypothetical protein
MVTYQLSKNFNRFANRIALNQENRPFDISLGSKTTTRNLLYNEYVELDTERKDNNVKIRFRLLRGEVVKHFIFVPFSLKNLYVTYNELLLCKQVLANPKSLNTMQLILVP